MRGPSPRSLVLGAGLALAIAIPAAVLVSESAQSKPVPWARLGTDDVHALAFDGGSIERLLFGHHGGILQSSDGGLTWTALTLNADAMGLRPAGESILVAGHEVFEGSNDGGRTWEPIAADLPNQDIHAFARDPADPDHLWAYLAEGGVYESTDGGARWAKVYDGHIPFIAATTDGSSTSLIGIEPLTGFARSLDGGRTWSPVSQPAAFPTFSMAATPDGDVVALGTSAGLLRSDDGGSTWRTIALPDPAFAIALSDDGQAMAVVTSTTEVYRSNDGGASWAGP